MKIKFVYLALVIILLIISISQIFTIPPYAGDIYSVYKSGYFKELDRGFGVTLDSFLNIKMFSKPVYGWIFLEDMRKKFNLDIKIYNNKGLEIPAPGETEASKDKNIIKIINSINPQSYSAVQNGKYYSSIPIFFEDKCRFCHTGINKKNIAGIMTFERDYDAYIYYSSERIIIFVILSLVLMVLLYLIIKWDPGKVIKELFDK